MFLFSIVIPTYNRAETLKRALDSLVTQTFKKFEVIVCDDGSTDNSREIAESFRGKLQLKYLWSDNWGGAARPRNLGVDAAQSDWLCFLDSDDWWYPSKLEVICTHTHSSDVIYHDLDVQPAQKLFPRNLFSRKTTRARQFHPPVFRDIMLNNAGIPNSSVVVRKSVLRTAGGFTESKDLIAVEDLDLWLKIARITERFTYIPRSLGVYWTGGGNISEVSEKQISRLEELHENHAHYLSNDDQKQAFALLHYNVGRIKYKNGKLAEATSLMKKALASQSLNIKFKAFTTLAAARLGLKC